MTQAEPPTARCSTAKPPARSRWACCDLHNTHCEPPGDLCCHRCTEAAHPDHRPGERCVLDGAVAGAASTQPTRED